MKKLILILSKKEKYTLLKLMLLSIAVAIAETLGVASVAPFVAIIASPEIIKSNPVLFSLYKMFGSTSNEDFAVVVGFLVLGAITLATTLKIINTKAYIKFTRLSEHEIGLRVSSMYLRQDYVWFANQNSAKLDSKILKEIHNVIYHVIEPGIILFAQSSVVLMITIMLMVVNPVVSLIAIMVLGTTYGVISLTFKTFLRKKGNERLLSNSERFVALRDLFGAIKEIKANDASLHFLNKFEEKSSNHSKVEYSVQLVAHLPRFVVELIAFGGMLGGLLLAITAGVKFQELAPTLTLFTFAAYKILPAMQQVHYSVSHLRYAGPLVEQIHNEIESLKKEEEIKAVRELTGGDEIKSIELQKIDYQYPNSNRKALKNFSMTINANTSIGIVGASGSGKTTLVDILLGLIKPNSGKIIINGIEVPNTDGEAIDKRIGYVPQNVYILDENVEKNIIFGNAKMLNKTAVINAAKAANIHHLITNELANGYKSILGERGARVSGGERQRIGIARALYRNAQVLILDEASSSLDTITESEVMREIKKISVNLTLITIAHRLNTVKDCDVIYLLKDGELQSKGSYLELSQNSDYFRHLLNPENISN